MFKSVHYHYYKLTQNKHKLIHQLTFLKKVMYPTHLKENPLMDVLEYLLFLME